MPQAPSACLIQCRICNLLRKKGVEDSLLLRGNTSQGLFPRVTLFEVFFDSFLHLHLYAHLLQNTTKMDVQKTPKISKISKYSLTKSSLEIMPAKTTSKVWKSYSLQRFKPIFKVPRYPKKAPKLDPKWTPKLQNIRKLRSQKSDKKHTAHKSSKVSKLCPNLMVFSWRKRFQNH